MTLCLKPTFVFKGGIQQSRHFLGHFNAVLIFELFFSLDAKRLFIRLVGEMQPCVCGGPAIKRTN